MRDEPNDWTALSPVLAPGQGQVSVPQTVTEDLIKGRWSEEKKKQGHFLATEASSGNHKDLECWLCTTMIPYLARLKNSQHHRKSWLRDQLPSDVGCTRLRDEPIPASEVMSDPIYQVKTERVLESYRRLVLVRTWLIMSLRLYVLFIIWLIGRS